MTIIELSINGQIVGTGLAIGREKIEGYVAALEDAARNTGYDVQELQRMRTAGTLQYATR